MLIRVLAVYHLLATTRLEHFKFSREECAAQQLQEIDKAALVCPPASRPARAIRAPGRRAFCEAIL